MQSVLERRARHDGVLDAARVCVLRAETAARSGRHAAAERMLREHAAAFRRRGALQASADLGTALACLLHDRGRLDAADRVLREAIEAAQAAGDSCRHASARLWRTLTLLELTRVGDAYALAHAVEREAPDHGHRLWARAVRACALRTQGSDPAPDPTELALAEGESLDIAAEAAAFVDAVAVEAHLADQDLFAAGRRARIAVTRTDGAPLGAQIRSRTAHFMVIAATGDVPLIHEHLAELERLIRNGHLPLRAIRPRLVWFDVLMRLGGRDAARQTRRLARLRGVATPLLRAEIDRRLARSGGASSTPQKRTRGTEDASCPLATTVTELVGLSQAMEDVRAAVVRAARAPFATLIEGESGVGKELVARAIHRLGPRAERRLVDLNCAALPDDLLDAELFGHARGAFTGAVADRPGLFEDASGGTLFLDEVADLSARAQARLLRVIQQQEVRRVGETRVRSIDLRLITAANRDMRREAAEGRFRHDLLYRLDVIRIQVPPLRDRPTDIEMLARFFWRVACDRVGCTSVLAPDTLTVLARYPWPGNVRELQNVMFALAVRAPARGAVDPSLLPETLVRGSVPRPAGLAEARAEAERHCIERMLVHTGGNRTQAARHLGVSRQGLLKAMERLGIAGR
jgi:DNA-binding NtrC family response regulator